MAFVLALRAGLISFIKNKIRFKNGFVYYAFSTLSVYSPVSVLMRTMSPGLMKRGTFTFAPVTSSASLLPPGFELGFFCRAGDGITFDGRGRIFYLQLDFHRDFNGHRLLFIGQHLNS